MGGESKSSTTQSSQTNPWEPSMPLLNGILGQLNGQLGNTGLTGAETGALNSVQANANQGNPYAGQINSFASDLLSGGGATNQAGAVQSGYDAYKAQTNPLASNTNYDPMQTPGIGQQLQNIMSDVGGGINAQFAAAGRDMSGANQQAWARGVTQGMAPILTNQYNQNVQNQQQAAGNLFNAGNTAASTIAGMQQQGLANKLQGVTTSGDALSANNYGANQTLAVEAQRRSAPVQNLGLLANIGIPIAGLGGQSTGTSNTTAQMSGADQFAKIVGGIGNLIPKGPMTFNF